MWMWMVAWVRLKIRIISHLQAKSTGTIYDESLSYLKRFWSEFLKFGSDFFLNLFFILEKLESIRTGWGSVSIPVPYIVRCPTWVPYLLWESLKPDDGIRIRLAWGSDYNSFNFFPWIPVKVPYIFYTKINLSDFTTFTCLWCPHYYFVVNVWQCLEWISAKLHPLVGLDSHDAHLAPPVGQGRHLCIRYAAIGGGGGGGTKNGLAG